MKPFLSPFKLPMLKKIFLKVGKESSNQKMD